MKEIIQCSRKSDKLYEKGNIQEYYICEKCLLICEKCLHDHEHINPDYWFNQKLISCDTVREVAWGRERLCVCVFSHSVLSDFFVTSWAVAHQAPLSMGSSQQEYCSGLPFPPPGIFLTQWPNFCLLCLLQWQADSLPLSHLEIPRYRPRL